MLDIEKSKKRIIISAVFIVIISIRMAVMAAPVYNTADLVSVFALGVFAGILIMNIRLYFVLKKGNGI